MKNLSKLICLAFAFTVSSTFAAEAPEPTFSIWGEPASGPLDYYDLIKNVTGQEFTGYTLNCVDGGSGPNDSFILRVQVFNAATGGLKYEMTPLIDSPNITAGLPDCIFSSLGLGVASSGTKRVIVFGMAEANNAVIYGYNAETGAKLYNIPFQRVVGDYTLATPGHTGEWSAVGNFLNDKSDQLRVTYFKGNVSPGPVEIKVTYYNVLTGAQIGNTITMTVPTPAKP